MKIEVTDVVVYTGFFFACVGMPFLLRSAFGVSPGWSIVIGFPLGYVVVMAACGAIAFVAHCVGSKPGEDERP